MSKICFAEVRRMADEGYSVRAVALHLGYGYVHLLNNVKKMGIEFKPIKDRLRECKGGGGGNKVGRPRVYSDDRLLEMIRNSKSSADFCGRTHISMSVILNRFGSWKNAQKLATKGCAHNERG